ncbi:MAG TPA: metalloregulator ArsR/SmtB family transcription factor [Ktedonobacterales bacterium]|nr:metalloregulator ArsR/SmtB family transcription factor [Ktedonobacterales bacterium]
MCLELPRAAMLRDKRLSVEGAQFAATAAQALADPTRLIIAALLRDGGELCVCDLAWLTGKAISLVSHHLKTLRAGDLATARRAGKLVLYTLTPRGRELVEALLQPTQREVAV